MAAHLAATYASIDFAARVAWWRERWRGELVGYAAIVVAEQAGALTGFVTINAKGYLDQLVVGPDHWGSPLPRHHRRGQRNACRPAASLVNKDDPRHPLLQRNGFAHAGEDVTRPRAGRGAEDELDRIAAAYTRRISTRPRPST